MRAARRSRTRALTCRIDRCAREVSTGSFSSERKGTGRLVPCSVVEARRHAASVSAGSLDNTVERRERSVASMRMSGVPFVVLQPLAHADDSVLRVANRSIKANGIDVVATYLQIDLWTALTREDAAPLRSSSGER